MARPSSSLPQRQSLETSYVLAKVYLVIDLDGFRFQERFVPREMGWCTYDNRSYGWYHYYPWLPYVRLSAQDQQTAGYVQRHVHGLSYYPSEGEWRRFRHLRRDLLNLYQRSKTVERPYVAYKGGTLERDLLHKLNILAWNLEEAGCPKIERLLRLCTVGSCGQHEDPFRHHCPRVECYHFVQWRRLRLNLSYETNYIDTSRLRRFVSPRK